MKARWLIVLGMLLTTIQLRGSDLDVARIHFDLIDEPGGREPWYQIAIEIDVRTGDGGTRGSNPRFADEVTVSLAFASARDTRGERIFSFYSAIAEYPTLEVGRHVVRFYLPPEVAKRNEVRGEPFAYEISVTGGGERLDYFVSPSIESPAALDSFHARLTDGAGGVLRQQIDTPFAWLYPEDSPNASLVR